MATKLKEILKRLEEIEARAAKATPGPWAWEDYSAGWSIVYARVLRKGAGKYQICDFATRDDAEFIVACREFVPQICQTVRQLVAQLKEVEAQCAAMREALKEISRTEQDEKPDGTILGYLVHDAYEMCGIADAALRHEAGLELLDRLRRLEAVAEAARKIWGEVHDRIKGDFWVEISPDWEGWEQLERALAALEEVNDES